jgi:transposase-like protein
MTNKIGYNQYPNLEEFKQLYMNMSQEQLANYYQCNKKRVNKWIKYFGLNLRPRGGGNNRKYKFSKEKIEKLLKLNYSIDEVCEILNMKRSSLYSWMKKYGVKKIRNSTEYEQYQRKVRWLTEKNYVSEKSIINPNNYPRTLCGVDGGYQLDHILGVYECFNSNISEEECASIKNLQMIPWKENLKKRNFYNYKKGLTNE